MAGKRSCPWKGMKFEDTKDRTFQLRMDEETLRKLDALAKHDGVSRSAVIRACIEYQYETTIMDNEEKE